MVVKKEKVSWSLEAEKALLSALGADLEEVKLQVETGSCELWRYDDGGYCVTRIEVSSVGNCELVIVASGVRRGAEKLNEWIDLARQRGWNIRIHSKRKGMKAFVEKKGFQVLETVYRWQYGR